MLHKISHTFPIKKSVMGLDKFWISSLGDIFISSILEKKLKLVIVHLNYIAITDVQYIDSLIYKKGS